MYFKNKFNKNIQRLVRSMEEWGAETSLGDFNDDLFIKRQVISKDGKSNLVKVYPLVMYDTITSSNSDDIILNNSNKSDYLYNGVAICDDESNTKIKCSKS